MNEHESVSHLAGGVIEYNAQEGLVLRQRCSWCGAILIDENLDQISVPTGQEGEFPTWGVGEFVRTYAPDGGSGMWMSVEWKHPDPVPEDSCMRMPLEVTG